MNKMSREKKKRSFVLDFLLGFCNKKLGRNIMALNAISFQDESSTYAFSKGVISLINSLTALPVST